MWPVARPRGGDSARGGRGVQLLELPSGGVRRGGQPLLFVLPVDRLVGFGHRVAGDGSLMSWLSENLAPCGSLSTA